MASPRVLQARRAFDCRSDCSRPIQNHTIASDRLRLILNNVSLLFIKNKSLRGSVDKFIKLS